MTTKERQAAYRARQTDLGRKQITQWLTPDEEFYLCRVLLQMRKTGGKPAMMRRKNGTLEELDA